MAKEGNATPQEIRTFFEQGGAPKVETKELLRLKKNPDGTLLPDYDQIAQGIANGTLTY